METRHNTGVFTYQILSDKERKNLILLDLIRKNGPISRTDLSKTTGINIVSISNYVKDYIEAGVVSEKGLDESSGGRPAELVELQKDNFYCLGLGVSESGVSGVITDLAVKILHKDKILMEGAAKKELCNKAVELIQKMIDTSVKDLSRIKSIGIGVNDAESSKIREEVEKKFKIPVFTGSNASCAAFGEKMLNKEADVADLLYMYSDVGCGIIIRGDIYLGAGGSAGEMQATDYLRPWDVYLGIVDSAKREVGKGIGTKIVSVAKGDPDNITKDVVIEAAKQGDEVALTILQVAAMNLGLRVSYLINLFNPEVVVIGGGIEKAGDIVMSPIKDKVRKFAFQRQADIVKIIPSILGEDAVPAGASALAAREIFIKT